MKAIYAGSFNPIHSGHIDIIRRASKLFGGITLLVADNPSKHYLLTNTERTEYARKFVEYAGIKNVTVDMIVQGQFLADYCRMCGIDVIVKGLRNGVDLDSEFSQEWYTKNLNSQIETVYLSTDPKLKFVSSTAIKTLVDLPFDQFKYAMYNMNRIDGMDCSQYEEYLSYIYYSYRAN